MFLLPKFKFFVLGMPPTLPSLQNDSSSSAAAEVEPFSGTGHKLGGAEPAKTKSIRDYFMKIASGSGDDTGAASSASAAQAKPKPKAKSKSKAKAKKEVAVEPPERTGIFAPRPLAPNVKSLHDEDRPTPMRPLFRPADHEAAEVDRAIAASLHQHLSTEDQDLKLTTNLTNTKFVKL